MIKQEIEFAADRADKYSDLISRNVLLEELREHRENVESDDHPLNIMYCIGIDNAINRIEMQPVIDAAPVAHGEWIREHGDYGKLICSRCFAPAGYKTKISTLGYNIFNVNPSNFCPNCGAIMDENKTQI